MMVVMVVAMMAVVVAVLGVVGGVLDLRPRPLARLPPFGETVLLVLGRVRLACPDSTGRQEGPDHQTQNVQDASDKSNDQDQAYEAGFV